MTVVIEEIASGRFYKTDTEWVKFRDQALCFPSSQAAIEFCVQQTLPDVRLLVSFENAEHNFYLYPFGSNELAAKTEELLACNAELRERQWALNAQVSLAAAEVNKAVGESRRNRSLNIAP